VSHPVINQDLPRLTPLQHSLSESMFPGSSIVPLAV
jgi:hypothetical protein